MFLTVFLTLVFCLAITLMIFFDYFLLMKFYFFQFYFPEVESVYENRKYGYNIKSQLVKLLIIFPAVSAVAAWVCNKF